MQILNWIAYASWAAAAACLLIAMSEESFVIFATAVSAAISGVLFFAFSKVIALLSDIRDAVVRADDEPKGNIDAQTVAPAKPARSMEEISADLEKLKSRQN